MDAPKKKKATYQDVLEAPQYRVAEIIAGQLRLTPRPGGPAAEVASALLSIEPFEAIELDLASLWQDLPFPSGASEPSSDWEYESSGHSLPSGGT